jgi:hypothetical protein
MPVLTPGANPDRFIAGRFDAQVALALGGAQGIVNGVLCLSMAGIWRDFLSREAAPPDRDSIT